MPQLKVISGSNEGESFRLDGEVTLGRSLTNSICLLDGRASRRHARIYSQSGRFFVEDLKSANGTYLNSAPLLPGRPRELHDGDELLVSATRMVFCEGDPSLHKVAPGKSGLHTLPVPLGAGDDSATDFGNIAVSLSSEGEEGGAGPEVEMAIDASLNMASLPSAGAGGLEESVRRLKAMCEVSIALGTVADQSELMNRIMAFIFDLFPKADRAFIMLLDREGHLQPVAARTRQGGDGEKEQVAISRTILNQVLKNKRSVISCDAQQDERFGAQMSIVNLQIRSLMCAPLMVGQEILGIIQVDSASVMQRFAEEDLQLLTGVGAQAGVAVKNAQLYSEVEAETARRTSLQRYFSPNMVDLIMSGGVGSELGGKKYFGTVFFSDIIGFTALSEKLPPQEVVSRLNSYFTIMQRLIYQNGGNVDKFGGDAIMAFWSVPVHKDGDELRAVLTGLQMQAQLFPFNLQLASEGSAPVHMGIGLNTGEFVAGNIGSTDKIEFTLIGDQVNLASRIEGRAGRGQVFVSESTYGAIKGSVCAVQLPPAHLKNKTGAAQIYSIRGLTLNGEDLTLSLPCEILDIRGKSIGPGLVAALASHGPDLHLILMSAARLPQGETIGLRLEVAEHHQPLALVTRVEASTEVRHDCGVTHARNLCADVKGEAALQWLRPGGLIATAHGWEHLRRG